MLRLADQLHDTSRVDDSLWDELSKASAPDQLLQLLMLGGLYRAVSYIVNSTGVEHEAFAPRFASVG